MIIIFSFISFTNDFFIHRRLIMWCVYRKLIRYSFLAEGFIKTSRWINTEIYDTRSIWNDDDADNPTVGFLHIKKDFFKKYNKNLKHERKIIKVNSKLRSGIF